MIAAKETPYRYCRFRSRLEARWAVFFDALNMPWEYEKEGYDLPGAGAYLPDFWITKIGRPFPCIESESLWAEVKPAQLTSHERAKCEALVRETGTGCLVLVGLPDFTAYELICHDSLEGGFTDEVLLHSSKNRIWYSPSMPDDLQWHLREQPEYVAAVHAARSARFEHGEQGR